MTAVTESRRRHNQEKSVESVRRVGMLTWEPLRLQPRCLVSTDVLSRVLETNPGKLYCDLMFPIDFSDSEAGVSASQNYQSDGTKNVEYERRIPEEWVSKSSQTKGPSNRVSGNRLLWFRRRNHPLPGYLYEGPLWTKLFSSAVRDSVTSTTA